MANTQPTPPTPDLGPDAETAPAPGPVPETARETHTASEALARFKWVKGAGSPTDNTACAMTGLSWMAGEAWSDSMPCAHKLLRNWIVKANDDPTTTPEEIAAIVVAGETGVIDTWWVPTIVVLSAWIEAPQDAKPGPRIVATIEKVAEWKGAAAHVRPPHTCADRGAPHLRSADLRSADLGSANLGYVDLRSANLGSANLGYADLRSADLRSANLRSANLRYANLRYANLGYVDLRSADLGYVDLRSADLGSADLGYANLRYANLGSADLGYADLGSANLGYVDLRSADLGYANLRYANLGYANLRYANLGSADLGYAHNVSDSYLAGARYSQLTLWPVGFDPKAAGAVLEP